MVEVQMAVKVAMKLFSIVGLFLAYLTYTKQSFWVPKHLIRILKLQTISKIESECYCQYICQQMNFPRGTMIF